MLKFTDKIIQRNFCFLIQPRDILSAKLYYIYFGSCKFKIIIILFTLHNQLLGHLYYHYFPFCLLITFPFQSRKIRVYKTDIEKYKFVSSTNQQRKKSVRITKFPTRHCNQYCAIVHYLVNINIYVYPCRSFVYHPTHHFSKSGYQMQLKKYCHMEYFNFSIWNTPK